MNPPASFAENVEFKQEEKGTALVLADDSSVVVAIPITTDVPEQQLQKPVGEVDKEEDRTEEEQAIEVSEVQLSLPENVSAEMGNILTIPVLLNNETSKEISSYNFAVRFDPNLLQPETMTVETADSLSSNGFTIQSDTKTRGRIGIAASALNNSVSSSGTLIYLRFRVLEPKNNLTVEGTSTLTFEKTRISKSIFEDSFGNRISSASTNGLLSVEAGKSKD